MSTDEFVFVDQDTDPFIDTDMRCPVVKREGDVVFVVGRWDGLIGIPASKTRPAPSDTDLDIKEENERLKLELAVANARLSALEK